jgi:hypothetical protein
MIKKILVFLLIALVLIQFFRPKKNIAATASTNNNIAAVYNTPDDVKQVLEVGCNDCHSNNTRYPWYAEVQPVAWWLDDHITEGKKELNFDEFKTYSPRRQYNKLKETIEQVKKGEMPLNSYTWIHKDAILNQEQKDRIINWAQNIRVQMEQTYPKDSLVRKK